MLISLVLVCFSKYIFNEAEKNKNMLKKFMYYVFSMSIITTTVLININLVLFNLKLY